VRDALDEELSSEAARETIRERKTDPDVAGLRRDERTAERLQLGRLDAWSVVLDGERIRAGVARPTSHAYGPRTGLGRVAEKAAERDDDDVLVARDACRLDLDVDAIGHPERRGRAGHGGRHVGGTGAPLEEVLQDGARRDQIVGLLQRLLDQREHVGRARIGGVGLDRLHAFAQVEGRVADRAELVTQIVPNERRHLVRDASALHGAQIVELVPVVRAFRHASHGTLSPMSIVVGLDASAASDVALAKALELVEGDETIHVVHVVSQIELDATGELTFEDKRARVLERTFPEIWKRVRRIAEERGKSDDEAERALDVQLRFAPVHVTAFQRKTAEELVTAMDDYRARLLVLGREGRPGSVAENVLASGRIERETADAGAPHGIVLRRRG